MTPSTIAAAMSEAQKRAKRRRHCGKCELPTEICACAEARAYDRANPL